QLGHVLALDRAQEVDALAREASGRDRDVEQAPTRPAHLGDELLGRRAVELPAVDELGEQRQIGELTRGVGRAFRHFFRRSPREAAARSGASASACVGRRVYRTAPRPGAARSLADTFSTWGEWGSPPSSGRARAVETSHRRRSLSDPGKRTVARSVDCNVILKYCEILDEFVKVRVFTEEDIAELLKVKEVPNRNAYQQLVVNACVVNFLDEVVPLFKRQNRVYKTAALEELLYQICVEVNPQLEIHQVALPMNEAGEAG